MSPRALLVRAALVAVALAALAWIALASLKPPAVVSASAPATEFSAERAMAHVRAIAAKPHRIGSTADAEVVAYLMRTLTELGLSPETRAATVVQERWASAPPRIAEVKNVVARIRGARGNPAVLLMAHHDTRSMTPGAGDDTSGVATLLETARAMMSGPPPMHDVIFLFTDGEEVGLMGAKAFIAGDANDANANNGGAADVGVVLNFDARGARGAVMMFQTSDGASALVSAAAEVAPAMAANSLSQLVYKRMPNDSDLTEWLDPRPASALAHPVGALNFAMVGGFERYHSPTDTADNLDPRTLQHMGSYALPIARALASREAMLARGDDLSYVGVGGALLRWPSRFDRPLATLASLAWLAATLVAVRRDRARPLGLLLGTGAALASALLAMALANAASALSPVPSAESSLLPAMSPALKEWLALGSLLLAAAAPVAIIVVAQAKVRAIEIALGAGLLFAMAAIATALLMPGAAFVVSLPLLGFSLGALARFFLREDKARASIVDLLAIAPAVLFFVPLAAMLLVVFGVDAAIPLALLTALAVAMAAPIVRTLAAPSPRVLPVALLLIALGCLLAARATPRFDARSPRPDTLFYAVDADAKRAFWVTAEEPDAWESQVAVGARPGALPKDFFRARTDALYAKDAPVAVDDDTAVEIVSDARASGGLLELRVRPPAATELVMVRIDAGELRSLRVQGSPVRASSPTTFYYYAPPSFFAMSLEGASAHARVRVLSQRAGFPAPLAGSITPRPAELMPKPGMLPPWDEMMESDMTVVARAFTL